MAVQLMVTMKEPSSNLSEEILHRKVLCRARFMLDGKEILSEEQLPWFSLSSSSILDRLRENFTHSCRNLDRNSHKSHQHIYIRYGSLRLRGSVHLVTKFLPDDDSRRVREIGRTAIKDFTHVYPDEKFWLEVNWNYSYLALDLDAPDVLEQLGDQLNQKMSEASGARQYLSRADFRPFQDIRIIEKCLDTDPIARYWSEDVRQSFATRVLEEAMAMYLACAYAGVPLSYLSHLFSYNICSTESLPDRHDCFDMKCKSRMRRLRNDLPMFSAYVFGESRELGEIEDSVVLPLHFGTADVVGYGAYSEVFRVRIDPAHHNFQEDHESQFALKMFRERPMVREAFETERKAQTLLHSSFHPHILLLLMSWTQNNRHYILYPLADQNLRQFMQSAKPPVLTASNVIWLLRELRGLVDAVSSIHNLARANASELIGWHHDIKPENVLVFVDQPTDPPVFKLCDFGTAKFNLASGTLSHTSGKLKGTVTYEPPDLWLTGSVSRPADIWSLGCVFLEFFGWIFLTYEDAVLEFSSRRTYGEENDEIVLDDRFWLQLKHGDRPSDNLSLAKLRPAVVKQFALLQLKCERMRAFSETLQCIKSMLEIDPRNRPRADDLYKSFTANIEEAETELTINPHLYTMTTLMPSITAVKSPSKNFLPSDRYDNSRVGTSDPDEPRPGPANGRPIAEGLTRLHINEAVTSSQQIEEEPVREQQKAKPQPRFSLPTASKKWLGTPAHQDAFSFAALERRGDRQSRLAEENDRLRRMIIELGGNPDDHKFP